MQAYASDGTLDKERRYATVFAQSDRRTLVLMQSTAEQGQKVLMLGDDFWLLMPSSQRPLRITPMQKLLGMPPPATSPPCAGAAITAPPWSVWSLRGCLGSPPALPKHPGPRPQAAITCGCRPTRKGVTYQRIELWLGQQRHEPVRAQLYVQSDKLANASAVRGGPSLSSVSAMVLIDQLGKQKQTRIRYLARKGARCRWVAQPHVPRTLAGVG